MRSSLNRFLLKKNSTSYSKKPITSLALSKDCCQRLLPESLNFKSFNWLKYGVKCIFEYEYFAVSLGRQIWRFNTGVTGQIL